VAPPTGPHGDITYEETMKIIGQTGNTYDQEFICTVSRSELQKFMNTYYSSTPFNLKVGDTVDLGRGYDFAQKIESSVTRVQDLVKGSQEVINTILLGLNLKAIHQQAEEERRRAEAAVISGDTGK
jgi:hypothetical protein